MPHKKGRVEVICGSMFSGKTEELIRRIRRAQIAKKHTQVFKPVIDNRYHSRQVRSHDNNGLDAEPIENATQILQLLKPKTKIVGIDEGQFLGEDLISIVLDLVEKGINVVIAGLDTDFRGEPFGFMPILMALADEVYKIHAICMVCGEDAQHTQRIVNGKPARYDDPIIMVGAAESYEARCRDHHDVPGREIHIISPNEHVSRCIK